MALRNLVVAGWLGSRTCAYLIVDTSRYPQWAVVFAAMMRRGSRVCCVEAALRTFWSWCLENTVRRGGCGPALLLLETTSGRRVDSPMIASMARMATLREHSGGWTSSCGMPCAPAEPCPYSAAAEYWNCGACQRGRNGSTPLTAGKGQVTCELTA
jgi:hypothetical protein